MKNLEEWSIPQADPRQETALGFPWVLKQTACEWLLGSCRAKPGRSLPRRGGRHSGALVPTAFGGWSRLGLAVMQQEQHSVFRKIAVEEETTLIRYIFWHIRPCDVKIDGNGLCLWVHYYSWNVIDPFLFLGQLLCWHTINCLSPVMRNNFSKAINTNKNKTAPIPILWNYTIYLIKVA